MAISNEPAHVAINAMQAIPFGSMIGGPLKACIDAQALAAKTSWEFIKEVGLNTDKDGQKSAVMVSFSFNKDGHMSQLNVPLLSIVPIPYIAINDIDINFKANISASSSSFSENSNHTQYGGELDAKAKLGFGAFSLEANLKANYSTKKDSKATEESKYSVESTIDVAVKAGQESLPAGMAKVLEMLNSATNVVDAKGEISVNTNEAKVGDTLVITYKNPEGLYKPEEITVNDQKCTPEGDHAKFKVSDKKDCVIKAGKSTMTVKVTAPKEEPQKA